MDIESVPFLSREAFDRARMESDKPTFHPWDDEPVKGNIMDETPAETIERLTALNNQLAQMLKRGSDRLQESARELMAQGWDAGAKFVLADEGYNVLMCGHVLQHNPYRQPIDILGTTEEP